MDTAAIRGKSRRHQRRRAAHFRVTRFGGFDETEVICYLWDMAKAMDAGEHLGNEELTKLNQNMRRRVRIEMRRYFARRRRRNVSMFAAALLTASCVIGIFGFLIGIDRVSGNSMYPYLNHGDWVVYSRQLGRELCRDEVVIFENGSENLVKRVVGLPGDSVEINGTGSRVVVNGEEVREDYVNLAGAAEEKEENRMGQPLTVKDGQYLMLGDNRGVSIDSRDGEIGTVPREHILGKVMLIVRIRG